MKKQLVNPFTVFCASAVVFFWPVSLFFFTLKNDALTYYYPVRTLISDALRNGELPLWTPFINMGYPLHADMQSGAWNPVIWIFSFISNYSLGAFHYELLFYIAFAGIGFYYLCRNIGCSKTVAYTIAFAYQFSGFMIDSVQFFNCISAACYIPWVILFFRKTCMQYRYEDALGLSFCLFLLFTGGYPSMFIIIAYILLAYGIFNCWSRTDKIMYVKKLLPKLLISVLFFTLLCLPAIISFIQHLSMIERGRSQALSFVLENSLNPATTLSLLVPFATTAPGNFTDSNILMRSLYVGIIPLLFFIYATFNHKLRKNKELMFFFIMAVLMIGMAWGRFFFLRQIAYYILPLMDSFRHPALFRFFTIFFMLLISAFSMKEWDTNLEKENRFFKKIIPLLLIIVTVASIIAIIFVNNQHGFAWMGIYQIKNLFPTLDFTQRFLIQAPFVICTLLLAWCAIVKKRNIRLLCLVTIADLFFATQLNMPVTVIGSKRFKEVEALIHRNPEPFPIPDEQSIEAHSRNSSGENMVTGSALPFTKMIGRNEYYITPGNLSTQDAFYESNIRETVFKNPVIFFAGGLSMDDTLTKAVQKKFLLNKSGAASVHIKSFSANEIKVDVDAKASGIVTLLQNNYPGWCVFVDGKVQAIVTVNMSFMGTALTAGKHQVFFKYKPGKIIAAWYISIAGFSVLACWLVLLFLQKRNKGNTERKVDRFYQG